MDTVYPRNKSIKNINQSYAILQTFLNLKMYVEASLKTKLRLPLRLIKVGKLKRFRSDLTAILEPTFSLLGYKTGQNVI